MSVEVPKDLLYLGEPGIARSIAELGYRSATTLSRERFFQTKAELAAARNINKEGEAGGEVGSRAADLQSNSVLLATVKERFSANLEDSQNSIIFLSIKQSSGVEVGREHTYEF